ncbi:ATP-dependent DNA helicase PIF1-like [Rhizophagus irregularis DAOM 181602=DAOM 197198]|nr:ATP-dependent DNA helicase PIF1-like [Rhizophagus irregularis DAOM 181602=DAOM 197198]
MLHKFAFEAVDRTLRDITCVDKPFGGKVFVFGGDFRQVLPVIPRSLRADVVSSCLTRSFLWKHLKVMKLSINMRLSQDLDPQETIKQKKFAKFLLDIGDGNYSIVPGTEDSINLPLDLVMTKGGLPALIDFVYPHLIENYENVDYMVGKAILTPKNVDVEKISELVLDRLPGDFTIYPSADSVDLSEDGNTSQPQVYSPEFLRSLKIPDIPPGELKLKVGAPIILLRNLAPSQGLCNGTRMICRALQNKVIEAEIISGSHVGSRVFIPQMTLSPSDSNLPFILNRRQFPIRVAFSLTINKAQGQTLSRVGLYLPQPVFSHGQLYVALSRITSYQNIKVLIDNGCVKSQKRRTSNVVYKEVFA